MTLLSSSRSTNIEWISASLELLVAHIKGENMRGYFDVNKLSENFFCEILNSAYGYALENANKKEKLNMKAIDLIDGSAKLTFQVTSDSSRSKIRKTLIGFEESNKYLEYEHIKFMLLDRVKPPLREIEDLEKTKEGNCYNFNPAQDVISVKDLLNTIEGIDDDATVESIFQYLKVQVPLLDLLTETNIDDEIVSLVNDVVNKAEDDILINRNRDFVEVNEKIVINFSGMRDQEYIRSEYERCMERFKVIESVLQVKGPEAETILQSSMSDLYNKLKHDSGIKSNREIFDKMVSMVEQSSPVGAQKALRRLAIKSLVLFHFDDCTIFEKTTTEKNNSLFRGIER
ncbi:SMEK domain-containing protein [Streptomyces caniscabiei]|uniref:SMEK domain-containing protein n=1 Tax=Streptomyces caniscabiei TaxID=2746961 RepID=UPI0029B0C919|nr:SMEK domain-containing protein [Streptomyces caniscabiei]MDX2776503.1 SMEK domain-containing protein [Streptomyces caniscabiei]